MPIPIKFGTKTEYLPKPKVLKKKILHPPRKWTTSSTIPIRFGPNSPQTSKMRTTKSSTGNYTPCSLREPLFNIHLNVDYPFHLTGILYFPKMTQDLQMQKTVSNCTKTRCLLPTTWKALCRNSLPCCVGSSIVPTFHWMFRGVICRQTVPLRKLPIILPERWPTNLKAFSMTTGSVWTKVERRQNCDWVRHAYRRENFFEKAQAFLPSIQLYGRPYLLYLRRTRWKSKTIKPIRTKNW